MHYGSPAYRPRVVDAAAPAPSEPEDGRDAAHAHATPRRDDAAARAQMNEITPRRTSRNHRRLAHLRHYPAPGSIDWTRRASATEMRGNLGVQHQFARHLQKHRRASGHVTDCNWAPQRRPCFPRGLLLVMAAQRNSGTPRCAYAQCPKVKRIARRVLYPAENWCCSSARSVSRRCKRKLSSYTMGPRHFPPTSAPEYFRTLTQGPSVRPTKCQNGATFGPLALD